MRLHASGRMRVTACVWLHARGCMRAAACAAPGGVRLQGPPSGMRGGRAAPMRAPDWGACRPTRRSPAAPPRAQSVLAAFRSQRVGSVAFDLALGGKLTVALDCDNGARGLACVLTPIRAGGGRPRTRACWRQRSGLPPHNQPLPCLPP